MSFLNPILGSVKPPPGDIQCSKSRQEWLAEKLEIRRCKRYKHRICLFA
jgi:hypothetical protein